MSTGDFEAPASVHRTLAGAGQSLDAGTNVYFASRFGYDFSHVRVHTDQDAVRSAHEVGAQAYTVGPHIAFAAGRYAPQSADGRQLLAHELTHVVQQTPRLMRKAAVQTPVGAAARVKRVAALLEGYANRADITLAQRGGTVDVTPIRSDMQELRGGIIRLRQLAQQGDEQANQAALSGFAPQHLRAASRVLDPLGTSPPFVAVAAETPVQVATKSVTVEGADTAAEVEADRVAAAVMRSQPVQIRTEVSGLSMHRYLDSAGLAALESELPTVAAETGIADVALVGAATEEAALGSAAVIAAAGGPPGWVIGLAIVAVVAVTAGAGYLYYRSRRTQAQAQPQPSTGTQTDKRTVPEECEKQAAKLSKPGCEVTASLEHAGGDPLADLFCEEKTNSPCEYRVTATSGRAYFDAIRGTDVYECKCGYQSLHDAMSRGERWAQKALDDKMEQIRRHIRISKDCGLQYRIIVSNEAFGKYLRGILGDEVDVIVEAFEPCD